MIRQLMPPKLSSHYEGVFGELLAIAAAEYRPTRKLSVFWPLCGHDFGLRSPRLMVVGRAVNGWVGSGSHSTRSLRRAQWLR